MRAQLHEVAARLESGASRRAAEKVLEALPEWNYQAAEKTGWPFSGRIKTIHESTRNDSNKGFLCCFA